MYEIKTANFSSGISIFDFSNYWTMSKYCDGSMTLVIGKMKDETGGVRIVWLKPKMYSFETLESVSDCYKNQ